MLNQKLLNLKFHLFDMKPQRFDRLVVMKNEFHVNRFYNTRRMKISFYILFVRYDCYLLTLTVIARFNLFFSFPNEYGFRNL